MGAHASGWLILACMHNLWEDPVERRGQMASCYDIVTTEWEGHGRECSTYENPFLWMKRVSNPRHGRRTAFSSTSYTHWIPYFCNTASYRNARTCNGMFLLSLCLNISNWMYSRWIISFFRFNVLESNRCWIFEWKINWLKLKVEILQVSIFLSVEVSNISLFQICLLYNNFTCALLSIKIS